MNWIGSERGQRSTSQQKKSRRNAQPGEGEDTVLPHQQQPADRSAQPSHPFAPPATKLAVGQLWLPKGNHTKKDVVLPTQLAAPSFETNSILQHSLAPASHSRPKFTVQHTLTKIWPDKIHGSVTSPSLLLQDVLPLCGLQHLAAIDSEALPHWGSWEPKLLPSLCSL